MLAKFLSPILVLGFLAGCDGMLSAEDHGPPIAVADVSISPEDARKILSASKRFAQDNGLQFEGHGNEKAFTVYMTKGKLSIHSHNRVEPTRAEVGANDYGQMDPKNIELANRYVGLVRRTSSRTLEP